MGSQVGMFLLDTLLLPLAGIVLMRFHAVWMNVPMRNPIGEFIMALTDWATNAPGGQHHPCRRPRGGRSRSPHTNQVRRGSRFPARSRVLRSSRTARNCDIAEPPHITRTDRKARSASEPWHSRDDARKDSEAHEVPDEVKGGPADASSA